MSRYRSSYPLTSMAGGHGTDRLPSKTIPKVDKWRVEERCLSWGQRCGHVGRSMVHAFLQVALLLASFLGISVWVRFTTRVSRWSRLEEWYKFCNISRTTNHLLLPGIICVAQCLAISRGCTWQTGAVTTVSL